MEDNKKHKISLAIPTYNSSVYLFDCIKSLTKYSCVEEVVIQDDHSNEEEYMNIKTIVDKFSQTLNIKLFRNEKNEGAFINKFYNIKNCKNSIVYQIDSDNIPASNLDIIVNQITENTENKILYLPSKIYQFRKYHNLARVLSSFNKKYRVTYTKNDFVFDSEVLKEAIEKNVKFTVDKNINWILNSGNFFVNRDDYIKTFELEIEKDIRYPLDAVAISYFWIKNGGKIKTLKDLNHFHRKRTDSVSFVESKGSFESLNEFRNLFLNI